MIEPTWFTKREAAAYLRVSLPTLDRYVRAGVITRHKISGTQSVRFRRDELDALLEPVAAEEKPVTCGCFD